MDRHMEDQIRLLKCQQMNEEWQRLKLRLPMPAQIRSAKERTRVNDIRIAIQQCMRMLDSNMTKTGYDLLSREVLQKEYDRASKLLKEFDYKIVLPNSEEKFQTEDVNRPPDFVRRLPQLIIAERLRKGLSQTDVANRTGVPREQINRYERTMFEHVSFSKLKAIIQAVFTD